MKCDVDDTVDHNNSSSSYRKINRRSRDGDIEKNRSRMNESRTDDYRSRMNESRRTDSRMMNHSPNTLIAD